MEAVPTPGETMDRLVLDEAVRAVARRRNVRLLQDIAADADHLVPAAVEQQWANTVATIREEYHGRWQMLGMLCGSTWP